jgi:hypothetical protein
MPAFSFFHIKPDAEVRIYWTKVSVDTFAVDTSVRPWTYPAVEKWLAAVLEDSLNSCEK